MISTKKDLKLKAAYLAVASKLCMLGFDISFTRTMQGAFTEITATNPETRMQTEILVCNTFSEELQSFILPEPNLPLYASSNNSRYREGTVIVFVQQSDDCTNHFMYFLEDGSELKYGTSTFQPKSGIHCERWDLVNFVHLPY